MEINIKTREQKEFEEWAAVLVSICSTLSKEERTQVFNFAVFQHNNKEDIKS